MARSRICAEALFSRWPCGSHTDSQQTKTGATPHFRGFQLIKIMLGLVRIVTTDGGCCAVVLRITTAMSKLVIQGRLFVGGRGEMTGDEKTSAQLLDRKLN